MITALAIVVMLPLALILWVFLRALSVRIMSGKWPHEDEKAKALFDTLP